MLVPTEQEEDSVAMKLADPRLRECNQVTRGMQRMTLVITWKTIQVGKLVIASDRATPWTSLGPSRLLPTEIPMIQRYSKGTPVPNHSWVQGLVEGLNHERPHHRYKHTWIPTQLASGIAGIAQGLRHLEPPGISKAAPEKDRTRLAGMEVPGQADDNIGLRVDHLPVHHPHQSAQDPAMISTGGEHTGVEHRKAGVGAARKTPNLKRTEATNVRDVHTPPKHPKCRHSGENQGNGKASSFISSGWPVLITGLTRRRGTSCWPA